MQHFKFVNWRIRFLMSRTGLNFATNVKNSVKLQQVDQVPETEVASAVVLAKLVPFEVQPGLNPIF